jgi:hypothetical protein
VDSLGCPTYRNMSFANTNNFGFSFLVSYLTAPVRTFRTMLNLSSESGNPYLVPNLRRNVFSLLSLSMLAVEFFVSKFTIPFHFQFSENDERVLDFCQLPFLHQLRCCMYVFHSINVFLTHV